jgi:hypothetical protein
MSINKVLDLLSESVHTVMFLLARDVSSNAAPRGSFFWQQLFAI